jgi:hypothetical protein
VVIDMKFHPNIKPAAWGAVAGAMGLAIIGFSWGGWMFGHTAEKMANARAEAAVVIALTPVCVAKFEAQADAATKLAEFRKISGSWGQRSYIEKGGWATIAGNSTPNSALAEACAEKLGKVT